VKNRLLGVLVLIASISQAQNQDPYETVIYSKAFNSASKVILDEAAIRKSKAPNIPTLLATQANISVVNSSFQPSSIFLRGGDSGHILIIVDGLPFYDASTTQKTFNLNEFDITTVKRIEVIKGSQSVLYGGQALSAVIKIDTFPTEVVSEAAATAEVGQKEHRKGSVYGMKALNEENGILARAVIREKNNRSPLKESEFKYRSRLFTSDVGYLHKSSYQMFFKATRIDDLNESAGTSSTGALQDTENFKIINQYNSITSGIRMPEVPFKPFFVVGYQEGIRKFEQPVMAAYPTSGSNLRYPTQLINSRAEIFPLDVEAAQLRIGTSFTKEHFTETDAGRDTSDHFQQLIGTFLKLDLQPHEELGFELGGRSDFVLGSDRVDTYQLGISFLRNWKLEYSTGFRTPSLFQLYSSNYGSKDLKPERSQTYSLSYERSISERQSFSMTLFDTYFSDLIQFQGTGPTTGQYRNVSRVQARGVEAQYSVTTEGNLRTDLSLGYQEPRDLVNARWLPRRPLHSGGLRVTQTWDNDSLGMEVVGNSTRLDTATGTRNLEGYVIAHAFYNHEFSPQFSTYLRGNNITDKRYEQTGSYYDEGAFFLIGMEMRN